MLKIELKGCVIDIGMLKKQVMLKGHNMNLIIMQFDKQNQYLVLINVDFKINMWAVFLNLIFYKESNNC